MITKASRLDTRHIRFECHNKLQTLATQDCLIVELGKEAANDALVFVSYHQLDDSLRVQGGYSVESLYSKRD